MFTNILKTNGLIFASLRSVYNFLKITCLLLPLLACGRLSAQSQNPERLDVFTPISKYIVSGDAECLSAWFDENLDLSVIAQEGNASRNQAKRIIKAFFSSYTPRDFTITHTAEKANMNYALGNLSAGGENFTVTIFITTKGDGYKIQQFKIEKM